MKRKIYDELVKWKNESNGKNALLIDGARRVGKSYIVKQFAEENYKSYILIDFNNTQDSIKQLFYDYLDNLDNFFLYLSTLTGTKLYERESLIIFDEVEMFPKARSAIKYLVEDGRYDYIETGSLISIKENVEDILIPSEEHHLNMYPMDFEEFVTALGNEMLLEVIRKAFEEKKPLEQGIHRTAMDYFRKYMIVGGMPQAVETFIETNDFEKVDSVKRDILRLYQEDIGKTAAKYKIRVKNIFDKIPAELQKHDKKFTISSINKDARYRDYEDAVFWLSDSMIVNLAYNVTDPNIGLKLSEEYSTFKCYMGDTGLLISQAFDENGITNQEIYKKILLDKLEFNEGMIYENIIAQMLVSSGHKLYFYSKNSTDREERMEVDFLIAKGTTTDRHNISPIEVKSSQNYTLSSLKKFTKKFSLKTSTPYVIHTGNFKEEEGITYIPSYMTYLL